MKPSKMIESVLPLTRSSFWDLGGIGGNVRVCTTMHASTNTNDLYAAKDFSAASCSSVSSKMLFLPT